MHYNVSRIYCKFPNFWVNKIFDSLSFRTEFNDQTFSHQLRDDIEGNIFGIVYIGSYYIYTVMYAFELSFMFGLTKNVLP